MAEISTHNQPLNLVRIARGLLPEIALDNKSNDCLEEFLLWPPDLFALTSRIMSITGCYTHVVSPPYGRNWPPKGFVDDVKAVTETWKNLLIKYYESDKKKFADEITEIKTYSIKSDSAENKIYRGSLIKKNLDKTLPTLIEKYWEDLKKCVSPIASGDISDSINEEKLILLEETDENYGENEKNWKGIIALIFLHAVADNICEHWGIIETKESFSIFQEYAEELLLKEGTMAHINILRCRILPKRHSPKVGITLRSMSANLAYHRSSTEIEWRIPQKQHKELQIPLSEKFLKNSKNESFSILLFPLPKTISGKSFQKSQFKLGENSSPIYEYFSYSPPYQKEREKWKAEHRFILDAITEAQDEAEPIDMVIFPECAFHEDEIEFLEEQLANAGVNSFITGVRSDESNQKGLGKNKVIFQLAHKEKNKHSTNTDKHKKSNPHLQFGKISYNQSKHHRWKIDKYQIERYNIGHRLSPLSDWWEAIEIPRRQVNFINIGDAFTICPLICEDLARQDPISDLIRTVGPSIVITILMDGPQKVNRWSSKYASVLSEDPGSCVITLTSAGMVDRYNQALLNSERIVSLYCDSKGQAKEIHLEKDSVGILLTLCLNEQEESIADGRLGSDNKTKTFSLGGIKQIRI